jgi:cytoskeletal protein CcmA (bactofilin family)
MSFFTSRRQSENEPQPTPPRQEPIKETPPPAPPPPVVGFETVIGANCTIEGDLTSSANIRIDGTLTGSLEINGNVLVGETARITADINAKNISIAGAVRGNINGKKVQLLRTSRVWGDINASALTMEEGGFIDGKITMIQPDAKPTGDDDADDLPPVDADEARLDSSYEEDSALPDEPTFITPPPADPAGDEDESRL